LSLLDGGAISNAAIAPPYRPLAVARANQHHPSYSQALPTPRTRSARIAARRHGLLAAFDQAALAEVLIVVGGPVGLTLAIDLARRSIEVTVAEMRAGGEPPSVKCNHVAARNLPT
jgi:NADPH-dependent 2,4-dienoyl-CoA reductase/sulfur reductase-like enzyme